MSTKIIVILGPTASGKTALAVQVARALNAEIVSADSRQIYQGLDIGSGKDLAEYGDVPYHLIDTHKIGEQFSVAHFQKQAYDAICAIHSRGKRVILCGGSGLYLDSLLSNFSFSHLPDFLDEPLALNLEFVVLGLNPALDLRRERISKRLIARLDAGMIAEAEGLLAAGISPESLRWFGLEYKWMMNYLEGQIDYPRFVDGLCSAIHQFAKRQMTYFRKMERAGITIQWIPDVLDMQTKCAFIIKNI